MYSRAMAGWREAHWEPSLGMGLPAGARRGGRYRAYDPDPVSSRPLTIDADLSIDIAQAERAIRALAVGSGSEGLAGIARFLLRSEAIASSRIEGLTPSGRQVALAELGTSESVRGVSHQARLVANNVLVVGRATAELVGADRLTVDQIVDLHDALLPDDPNTGLRTVQNWIGGSDWNPIDASFVPPLAQQVPRLMTDLVAYANGAGHSAIVQAALVHAQFETIHPFTDGNGRVGRALIHTVLTRRGLTPTAILPVSLVFATLQDHYLDGLTAYRYQGAGESVHANTAMSSWIRTFVDACVLAAGQARELSEAVVELRRQWADRVAHARSVRGTRTLPRANSATARLLDMLPEAPVVTVRSLAEILNVSANSAATAVEELVDAGILYIKVIERGTRAYLADEILDLVSKAERRLASTRFDTSAALPGRSAPATPRSR